MRSAPRILAAHIEACGPLPIPDVVSLVRCFATSFEGLREDREVHAEVSPHDVLLLGVDGFAPLIMTSGYYDALHARRTNQPGDLHWLSFAAPERFADNPHPTPAGDVWSLGLTVFHAMTGSSYWRSTSTSALRDEITAGAVEPASVRASEYGSSVLPERFDAWFSRCLQLDPSGRFTSVDCARASFLDVVGYPPSAEEIGRGIETSFLERLRFRPGDDDERVVYADWLEERGQVDKAAFVRSVCEKASIDLPDPVPAEWKSNAAARWRAVVARPSLTQCMNSRIECSKRWSELTVTSDDRVRHCQAGNRPVYFCCSVAQARRLARDRECYVIDPLLSRELALDSF